MARTDQQLVAFNRGEISKLALGRVDVDKLRLAAEIQINWMPFVLGPMMMRPGFLYIGGVLDDSPAKFVPFIFAKTDTALLEFTNLAMRVWVNEAVVTRVSVTTSIQNDHFAASTGWTTTNTTSGASVSITAGVMTLSCPPVGGLAQAQQDVTIAAGDQNKEHALRIVITSGPVTFRVGSTAGAQDYIAQTVIDQGTHSLTFTPTGGHAFIQIETTEPQNKTLTQCSIEAAGALQLPAPWATSDLPNIRFDQSGDIVYVAAYGKPQYKIERRAARAWSVVLYKANDGPFQAAAGALNVNFTPSVYYGNGTLTSDQPYFNANHIGCLFRLFTNGQIYQTVLGALNAVTPSIRVAGVGASRNFTVTTSGTWVGTLSLEESFDGPDAGFVSVGTVTANGSPTFTRTTGGSSSTPDLDNIIAWYRVKFTAYTSGNATVSYSFTGGGAAGVCRVTGFTTSKSVSMEVLTAFSSLQATTDWLEGDWSLNSGYPSAVAFHESRLWWFGRDRMWGSISDNYSGHNPDTLGDSGPINRSFGSGPVDVINWGLSSLRLLVGREMAESAIRSSNFDVPITPTNFSAKDCSTQGSARLPPIKMDQSAVFVQQSKRKVYKLSFSLQAGDYVPTDLTRLNIDIGVPGFVDLAIARQPDTQMYFVRGDGQVAVLLHDVVDEVECWWRIVTAETLGGDGVVENVVALPGDLGDFVYFVVKRIIGGQTKRYLERMALRENCAGGSLNQIADSHVIYQGSATTTVTLAHLVGETVVIWADGEPIGEAVVPVGGITTLPGSVSASNIVAGLSYTAQFKSAKLAYGAQLGSSLTMKKKIDHVGAVLYDTHIGGLKMGAALDDDIRPMDNLPQVEDGITMDENTVYSEYDKPQFEFPGEWDSDSRLCAECPAPYPAKIGALVLAMETNEG